jgi:hypothetical protein
VPEERLESDGTVPSNVWIEGAIAVPMMVVGILMILDGFKRLNG